MKKISLIAVIAAIAFTSCTKEVASAPAPATASGPAISFKSYAIVTIGDSIRNVTPVLPFTLAAQNNLDYLNPAISALQCYVVWNAISGLGQPIQMGGTAEVTPDIAASIQKNDGASNCTMLQYQNKETDYYTDGSSKDILIGLQYYAIVQAN